jgi:Flp pilus assembly pilin Flp
MSDINNFHSQDPVNSTDKRQKGATMIEYALLASILILAIYAGLILARQKMSQSFSTVGSAVRGQ